MAASLTYPAMRAGAPHVFFLVISFVAVFPCLLLLFPISLFSNLMFPTSDDTSCVHVLVTISNI